MKIRPISLPSEDIINTLKQDLEEINREYNWRRAYNDQVLFGGGAQRIKFFDSRMECEQCHKVFTRSDNLRRHMKIHERSHPYPNPQSGQSNSSDMKSIDGIIDRAVLPLKDEIRNYIAKCHRFEREDRENEKKDELPTGTNEGKHELLSGKY